MKAGGSKLLSKGPLSGTLASPTTSKKCRILGLIPHLFFLVVLGLHCCMQAFSSGSECGLVFAVDVQASCVVEHGLSRIFPDQGSNQVPCTGRWINCRTTRESPRSSIGSPGDSGTLKLEKHWFQEFS